jgi:hypothetical protein
MATLSGRQKLTKHGQTLSGSARQKLTKHGQTLSGSATGRSDAGAQEEAGQVTARRLGVELARDVPLGSLKTLPTDNINS